jgi:hypothetical protein
MESVVGVTGFEPDLWCVDYKGAGQPQTAAMSASCVIRAFIKWISIV